MNLLLQILVVGSGFQGAAGPYGGQVVDLGGGWWGWRSAASGLVTYRCKGWAQMDRYLWG